VFANSQLAAHGEGGHARSIRHIEHGRGQKGAQQIAQQAVEFGSLTRRALCGLRNDPPSTRGSPGKGRLPHARQCGLLLVLISPHCAQKVADCKGTKGTSLNVVPYKVLRNMVAESSFPLRCSRRQTGGTRRESDDTRSRRGRTARNSAAAGPIRSCGASWGFGSWLDLILEAPVGYA
jgi:hypothetical protein